MHIFSKPSFRRAKWGLDSYRVKVKRNQTLSRGEPIARVKICKGLNMSSVLQSYIFSGGDSKQYGRGMRERLVFCWKNQSGQKRTKVDQSGQNLTIRSKLDQTVNIRQANGRRHARQGKAERVTQRQAIGSAARHGKQGKIRQCIGQSVKAYQKRLESRYVFNLAGYGTHACKRMQARFLAFQ